MSSLRRAIIFGGLSLTLMVPAAWSAEGEGDEPFRTVISCNSDGTYTCSAEFNCSYDSCLKGWCCATPGNCFF